MVLPKKPAIYIAEVAGWPRDHLLQVARPCVAQKRRCLLPQPGGAIAERGARPPALPDRTTYSASAFASPGLPNGTVVYVPERGVPGIAHIEDAGGIDLQVRLPHHAAAPRDLKRFR